MLPNTPLTSDLPYPHSFTNLLYQLLSSFSSKDHDLSLAWVLLLLYQCSDLAKPHTLNISVCHVLSSFQILRLPPEFNLVSLCGWHCLWETWYSSSQVCVDKLTNKAKVTQLSPRATFWSLTSAWQHVAYSIAFCGALFEERVRRTMVNEIEHID